jgi:hypothetical protein
MPINVIARGESDQAIQVFARREMDCFASLAMTRLTDLHGSNIRRHTTHGVPRDVPQQRHGPRIEAGEMALPTGDCPVSA